MRMLGSCVDLRRRRSCWKRCFGQRNPFHVVCVCWDGLVLRCADRPVTSSSVRRYRCCTRFDYQPSSIDNHLWEVPPPHKQRNIYIAPTMIYICINQQALEKSFARIHKTVKQMVTQLWLNFHSTILQWHSSSATDISYSSYKHVICCNVVNLHSAISAPNTDRYKVAKVSSLSCIVQKCKNAQFG